MYDEAHNLAVLACLMLLVEALEGRVQAGEVVVQEDDYRVLEDHPRLFEKHYHHQLWNRPFRRVGPWLLHQIS